jgi:hypothetical protein
MNKSATAYRRLKNTRERLRCLPDLPETVEPRYEERATLSHRRGQKRMGTWLKNA